MKATLEYNLPEEHEEHLAAVHAMDWKLVVWNYHEYLRKLFHDGDTTTVEKSLERLNEMIEDYGLTLD